MQENIKKLLYKGTCVQLGKTDKKLAKYLGKTDINTYFRLGKPDSRW